MCWSMVNVSHNKKKMVPYHARFVLDVIKSVGFFIKNSSL